MWKSISVIQHLLLEVLELLESVNRIKNRIILLIQYSSQMLSEYNRETKKDTNRTPILLMFLLIVLVSAKY